MKILIIGNGYLGNRCLQSWPDAVLSDKKIATEKDAIDLLEKHKPDVVLNAAGVVGKPNVDWCETHQNETIQGNTVLPIIIASACQKKNIYLLHMGTGCIFYGKSPSKDGWHEDDYANPSAVYTKTKYAADLVLSTLDNVGIARIRMPIDNISSSANLIDKLANYTTIVDVENSVTVVEDMINVFYQLLKRKAVGIFHVVNPGNIKHREIVQMYKKYIDPNYKCKWVSEKELVKQGFVDKKRSNNIMTSDNLKKLGIKMRPVNKAVEISMKQYASSFKKNK